MSYKTLYYTPAIQSSQALAFWWYKNPYKLIAGLYELRWGMWLTQGAVWNQRFWFALIQPGTSLFKLPSEKSRQLHNYALVNSIDAASTDWLHCGKKKSVICIVARKITSIAHLKLRSKYYFWPVTFHLFCYKRGLGFITCTQKITQCILTWRMELPRFKKTRKDLSKLAWKEVFFWKAGHFWSLLVTTSCL